MAIVIKKFPAALFVFSYIVSGCHRPAPSTKQKENISDSIITVKSIGDTTNLLKLCFSFSKVTHKTALWKPTLDDWFNVPISEDGLCHSELDTVIKLNADTTFIIFRTASSAENNVKITAHVSGIMYSIATAYKHGNLYEIVNFKKNLINIGSFGNGYDTLSVEKFGPTNPLICFSSGYTGNSTSTETKTYFETNYYTQVFEFNNFRSVGNSSDYDPYYREIQLHLIHIPQKEANDDILLKGTITYFDKKTNRIKKQPLTEIYKPDDFGNYKRSVD